jgi:hypothetical protein
VYDPSARVAGAPFLQLSETVELSALTNAIDVSEYRTLCRCNLLVLHRAKGASGESPSMLYKLCGKEAACHTGGQHFFAVHKQSMRTHADDGKIFKTTSDVVACSTKFGMALACPLAVAHIKEHCKKVAGVPPLGRRCKRRLF